MKLTQTVLWNFFGGILTSIQTPVERLCAFNRPVTPPVSPLFTAKIDAHLLFPPSANLQNFSGLKLDEPSRGLVTVLNCISVPFVTVTPLDVFQSLFRSHGSERKLCDAISS